METTVQNPAKSTTTNKNQYQVSIDLLNDAIGREIATTLQYMYFHARFEDARYRHLSRIMREVAIAEMRHTEEFSDRIFFLEGDVNMNAAFQSRQMSDTAEMLQFAMQLEQSTINFYNEASRIAAEHKDAVTHKMFQDIIAEEENHWTRSAPNCRICMTTERIIWRCSPWPEANMQRKSCTKSAKRKRTKNRTGVFKVTLARAMLE